MTACDHLYADIAAGIVVAWFLIRIAIYINGGIQQVTEDLQRYFDLKEQAKKALKEKQ